MSIRKILWLAIPLLLMANTPTPDPNDLLDGDPIATVDALQQEQPLTTDGEAQIFDDGAPLLPPLDSPILTTTFGYMKFLVAAESSRQVFGPFAPIVTHIRIFIGLTLAWFVAYYTYSFIRLQIQFTLFVARWVLRLIDAIK